MNNVNAGCTEALRHTVEIVCAKSDMSGLGDASPDDLERVLQNARIKIVFELDAANINAPGGEAHTDEEILGMFPTITRGCNPGADYYRDRMVSGYRLLCSALKKGGYSVADKDVATLLTQADLMENVPVWKDIYGTQEGRDLDAFLNQFRTNTDAGPRVTEDALKNCFGGLAGRLALRSASLNHSGTEGVSSRAASRIARSD